MVTTTWLHHNGPNYSCAEAIWKSNRIEISLDGLEFFGVANHGQTLSVLVKPDAFEDLAKAMMQCDYHAAIRAFGAALSAGLPTIKLQPRNVYADEILNVGGRRALTST